MILSADPADPTATGGGGGGTTGGTTANVTPTGTTGTTTSTTDTSGPTVSDEFLPSVEYSANSVILPIIVRVGRIPSSACVPFDVSVNKLPAIPSFGSATSPITTHLKIIPLPLPLKAAVMTVVRALLAGKVENFYDEDREAKTLINFGGDYQSLATNWLLDPSEPSQLLVKLYRPLPDDVETKTQVWIARELAPPVVDRLFVTYTATEAPKVYLRPPNRSIDVLGRSGVGVSDVTMTKLLAPSAFDVVRPSDPTLEQWFTFDVDSAELNVDYADYRNFVFFGSAQSRLLAFTNKLKTLEHLDTLLTVQSSSLAHTNQNITGSYAFAAIEKYNDQRVDVLRSFDPYERFLYYDTNRPYSSSLNTDDVDDKIYFNGDATWPKVSGSVVPPSTVLNTGSAQYSWYVNQLTIAAEYDVKNQDYLGNNVPMYLKNDVGSEEYLRFMDLVGHQFDTLRLYISQMTATSDRNSNPNVGMSPDVVWNVASSLGIDLPNQYTIKSLTDYTLGETESVSPTVYREAASETWKRFLHNSVFMAKTKGTKTALRTLANSYGILPTTLQIRETATVGSQPTVDVFEQFEEQTNSLVLSNGSYIELPWASLPIPPATIQVRVSTVSQASGTLLRTVGGWTLSVNHVSGTVGYVALSSDNGTILTPNFDAFNGEFFTVMVRNAPSGLELVIQRAEGASLTENIVVVDDQDVIGSVFTNGSVLQLSGTDRAFTGLIDEFRVWSELTTDENCELHTKYPGRFSGNAAASARDALLVRLSFAKAQNFGQDPVVRNESPFIRFHNEPVLRSFTAYNFEDRQSAPYSMEVVVREVVRYATNAATNYTTNKVTIAARPTLQYLSGSTIPVLRRDRSIVANSTRAMDTQGANSIGFFFSTTDAINDSIIRSIGAINLQDLLGNPLDQYTDHYRDLELLRNLYFTTYAPIVNQNSFIEFVETLLDPLFKQARTLVPARANLLSGIVHSPHILERNKVVLHQALQIDDELLEAPAIKTAPTQILGYVNNLSTSIQTQKFHAAYGTVPMVSASLMLMSTRKLAAEYEALDSIISYKQSAIIRSELDALETKINLVPTKGYLTSDVPMFGNSAREAINVNLATQFAQKSLPVNVYNELSTVFGPTTDFIAPESYTYFDNPNGYVAIPQLSYVRENASILTNRGTWVTNGSYLRNDYVVAGDGGEYVCVTTDYKFVSKADPSVDSANWRPTKFIPTLTPMIQKAVTINGAVSYVPLSSNKPVAVGYFPVHYRFTRDKGRGGVNHRHAGCLQTDATTTDGKPAVEITIGSSDKLVVTNGEPLQSNPQPLGPILDVQ